MLEQKLKSLHVKKDNLCGDLENKVLNQTINEIEKNFDNLYFVKEIGAQIRSRVQWVEQGEKNTKYFLGLEITRQTRKTINSLYDENGGITRQQTKILQLSKSYYKNLCKSTHPNMLTLKNLVTGYKIKE